MKVHLTLKLFPKIKGLLTVGIERTQRVFTKSCNYLRSLVQSIHLNRCTLDQRLQLFWAMQSLNQALDPSSADTTQRVTPIHLVFHPDQNTAAPTSERLMRAVGLLQLLPEAWLPVQQAVSTTSPLSVV